MREFKYKIADKIKVRLSLPVRPGDSKAFFAGEGEVAIKELQLYPERFIFLQAVGVKDSEGMELYEGDIVKTVNDSYFQINNNWTEYSKGEITWLRCGFSVCQEAIGANEVHQYVWSSDERCGLTIIGNAYLK